jgi:type I restriction enzyme M protein
MQWIAPSEKDTATDALEKRLWDAADQLRANSGLNAAQYSTPVLGLIFLRFTDVRFAKIRAGLEKMASSSRRGSRVDEPAAYHAEGVLYLTPNARFEKLLHMPEGSNAGKAINEAMRDIEKHNPQLAGVLPKTYEIFNSTLLKELLKRVSEIPATIDYDAFGRIYEYFLGEFARTEGQKGGEFYTPSGIVRLLVEVLEPYHGRILDPACGSGGMFVQSARFVAEHKRGGTLNPHPSPTGRRAGGEGAAVYSGDPSRELSIHGQEKVAATVALCRMNLAMHGLEGDIKEAITYYDDLHNSTGKFDFVLANPPFNVNAVDKERLEAEVGKGRRYPFGLPRTDNANYLWIQLFYSTLNATGRAGFVMANSASDARSSEQEIRKQLIEARAVDVMVAVGPNMFYTVTLPCTLWFFDKAKAKLPCKTPSPGSANHPLPKAEGRGGFKFQGLVDQARELRKKQTPTEDVLWQLLRDRQFADLKFRRQHQIGDYIVDFFCPEYALVVELDGAVHETSDRKKKDTKRDTYLRSLGHTVLRFTNARVFDDTEGVLREIVSSRPSPSGRGEGEGEQRGARYSDTVLFIDARHIYRQVDRAHRDWTEGQIGFLANVVRLYRGEEPDFTLGGTEAEATLKEVFGKKLKFADVPGLCKAATIKEIEAQGWSLNPGRYVGVAPGEEVSDEDFKEQLETLNEELETLNAQAHELEETIARNVAGLLDL